jgi:hypothetical protein
MLEDQYSEPLTDEEKLEKVKQFRDDGISGSGDLFDRRAKAEDYSIGKNQWDPATRASNERKKKFSLTIPIIKPQVNSVSGSHIQNPQDFKVYPLRGGSETIARLLTSLLKHATDDQLYRYQENMAFRSGVQSGEGDILFSLDWSKDPKHADLKVEKLNEHEVMWDPNNTTYDPNQRGTGAKYVIWEPWVDKDLMHAEYKDKAEELKSMGGGGWISSIMGHMGSIIRYMTGSSQELSATSFGPGVDTTNIQKHKYQVNHTWWRWPKKCVLWYDSRKSELDAKLLVKEKDIWAAKKLSAEKPEVFEVQEVVRDIMHHTIRVGDVFLEDRVDELRGCQMFPIGRYNSYYDNGYTTCPAEDLIGVQNLINYSHSAEVNNLKNIANSGIIIAADPTGIYADELADHAGEDGYVFDKSKAGGSIEFKRPNPPHTGYHLITEKAIEYAKMITGIRMVDPSTDKDRVMGTVIAKQRASNKDQAVIHSNWNYTQSIAGNLIIEIIRFNEIYSEDEIREIVDKDELIDKVHLENARNMVRQLLEEQGVQIPDEAPTIQIENIQNLAPEIQQATIDQYQEDVAMMQQLQAQIDQVAMPIAEQMLIDDIRGMKKGKYNTKVSLSPASETAKMARQFELVETSKILKEAQQLPIGRKFIIEATDLPNKEEIIAEGEQKMAAMSQAG